MNKKYYCIPTPPLLFGIKDFLSIPPLFVVLIGGLVFLVARNKSKKAKLFDAKFWELAIFILALTAFPIYSWYNLDLVNFIRDTGGYGADYLFAYVLFFGIFLAGNLLAKVFKLFKVSRLKIGVLAFLFLFSMALAMYVSHSQNQGSINQEKNNFFPNEEENSVTKNGAILPNGMDGLDKSLGCGSFNLW